MEKYPHSDLTNIIIGCAFEVHNILGYGLPEKIYQRAFAELLDDRNIKNEKIKISLLSVFTPKKVEVKRLIV